MSDEAPGYAHKLAWATWAAVYEVYCRLRFPGRRWEMNCPYCDETFQSAAWNHVVLLTDVHVAATEDCVHDEGDATVEADRPTTVTTDRNPRLLTEGGWSE